MTIIELAEEYIWEFLYKNGYRSPVISDTKTLSGMMHDGWTPTEIISGKADRFIIDNIAYS